MNHSVLFDKNKENLLTGKFITLDHCLPIFNKLSFSPWVTIRAEGSSVLNRPIHSVSIGMGSIKIFLWSQMHGNESTTTKSIFDLINFLVSNDDFAIQCRSRYQFLIVPMLNPDGANLFTRENANHIDLNRDFVDLSQPESKFLMNLFEQFNPDFCFNMHDQRSIFGVGSPLKPATVSFLAPAFNHSRDMNPIRLRAVGVINAMVDTLLNFIPNQIGRFDDQYNMNCVGDAFQSMNVPTILIEAGHYQGDYDREKTRFFVFVALLSAFNKIYENDIVSNDLHVYLKIPQNNPLFYDFVYRNVKIYYDNSFLITNFAAQFIEEIRNSHFQRVAKIVAIGALEKHVGHVEYDGKGETFKSDFSISPIINQKADFFIGNHSRFVNGLIKN